MPTVRGKPEVSRLINGLRGDIEDKLLRGAARAAANVVADEARERTQSSEVRGAIKVATRKEGRGRIVAKVQVKGPGAYLAPWEEYGTAPHFISVDESQRAGRSISRINQQANEPDANHSLVIGGKFVGKTVFHPGAQPHPFLRPAFDIKQDEAVAAAQGYVTARVTPAGIVGAAEKDDE